MSEESLALNTSLSPCVASASHTSTGIEMRVRGMETCGHRCTDRAFLQGDGTDPTTAPGEASQMAGRRGRWQSSTREHCWTSAQLPCRDLLLGKGDAAVCEEHVRSWWEST